MDASFIHTAQVLRESVSVASGVETFGGYAQVLASVPCLVEPMQSYRQLTVLGMVSGRVFCISWGTESLREGDRVVWSGRTFTLKLTADDRYRGAATSMPAYQTGVLTEDVLPRG